MPLTGLLMGSFRIPLTGLLMGKFRIPNPEHPHQSTR
jgi:hypothetical protein